MYTPSGLAAFAQSTPQNGFGQASKSFATSCPPGSLGEHTSSFAGEHQPHQQSSIGNLTQAGRGGSVSD